MGTWVRFQLRFLKVFTKHWHFSLLILGYTNLAFWLLRDHFTVVGLSTRPSPLIISEFLQFRNFWSQSRAFFMIRCTLTIGSWLKTFRVQKWPYWVQNFEFLLHKITNFRHISACQWTMPSGLFAKKNHTKFKFFGSFYPYKHFI